MKIRRRAGTHALRLIYSGLFDRFPRLQMILCQSRPAAYRMDDAARAQVAGGNALRLFGERIPLS
jgi:predicted TIM-barrel fold metal-dependent hydrolase